jgi:dihydroorotase
MSLADAVERMTVVPARILGLAAGTLSPGQAADVALIDPEAEWTFSVEDVFSKSRNTPFFGRPLRGRVLMTLLDGRAVHERPEIRRRIATEAAPRLEASRS